LSKKKGIAKRSPKGLVLDCSIVMAWYFVDESREYADEVARRLPQQAAFVPLNWPLEVANVLFMGGVIAPVPRIMRLFWAFSPSNSPESPSQEESSPASMIDTLEARCRSGGPPAGPRSIDLLPVSKSFRTASTVA